MPMYDYHCAVNGRTIEVVHGFSTRFATWGELCAHARIEPGDTPSDAPVERLVGGGNAVNAPVTPSKQNKRWGAESKNLKGSVMAAPPRKRNW